jgi:hypothetical protein
MNAESANTAPDSSRNADAGRTPMNPGDQAPAGTPGTGEDVCPKCGGSGQLGASACPDCGGTGKVNVGIGGA